MIRAAEPLSTRSRNCLGFDDTENFKRAGADFYLLSMFLNHRHKGVETKRRLWEGRLVLVVNVDGLLYECTSVRVRAKCARACFALWSNIAVLKGTQESQEAAIWLPIARSLR
jgi:hypothetical protein